MDFSKEHSIKYLRGAAQSLHEENRSLRKEQAELKADAERERAERAFLLAEIERMQAENAKLTEQTEQLRKRREAAEAAEAEAQRRRAEQEADIERLRTQVAEAERQRAELLEQLATLEAQMKALQELLAKRDKQLFGKKTERRPATEPTAEAELKADKPKKKKKQKGHGPTQQPDLPVVEVVHTLVGKGLECAHCGGSLEPLGTAAEEAELIALEERRIVLEQHLRMKYQCPCCHTGVVTAPAPVKLIPGGRYALSFTVDVAFHKYLGHMPLKRQADIFRHEGLKVSTNTLCDQMDALTTALTPTYLALWEAVQAERVLHADETPWEVLSNGHTDNERFYAWCAVGSQYAVYRLLDTRSKEGAAIILGDFSGTLVVDGLTSYPAAAKGEVGAPPRFKVANCHAHARRKFVECEQHWPNESAYAIELYRKLYDIERQGKEPAADLLALRQTESRPLVDKLFGWAREQKGRPDLLPSSGLSKALAYLLNHEAAFKLFLDDPAVPIDNNTAERAMRGPVLGRKNYYGSRSRRGTETAAVLYTLIESAKMVGVSPKAYIQAAVEMALTQAGTVLLPEEFKRQLDAVRDPPPADI
jgi:transposase